MVYEGNGGDAGESIPPRRKNTHYHGDNVRMLFFVAAVVLIIAQSTGAELPLSTLGSVLVAVVLVIAAGITNPSQKGIHWFNACIAVLGTVLFGTAAVQHYRAGLSVFDPSFTYTEALALLSLVALYFTTRTIRASIQHLWME